VISFAAQPAENGAREQFGVEPARLNVIRTEPADHLWADLDVRLLVFWFKCRAEVRLGVLCNVIDDDSPASSCCDKKK
jgi:hypothetical protein